jgi:hypothetical protein
MDEDEKKGGNDEHNHGDDDNKEKNNNGHIHKEENHESRRENDEDGGNNTASQKNNNDQENHESKEDNKEDGEKKDKKQEPLPYHGPDNLTETPYDSYEDVWDEEHVKMPFSPENTYKKKSNPNKTLSKWYLIQSVLQSDIMDSSDLEVFFGVFYLLYLS